MIKMFVILFLIMGFIISVFGDDGLPLILVNRVELEISKESDDNGNKLATYNYLNGDFVDITCLRPNDGKYNVAISGIKALHEILEVDQLSSHTRVGFRTTLVAAHNDSKLRCTCSREDGKYKVSVMIKLVLQDKFDDVMDIKINDMPIRSLGNTIYKYYYLSSEKITLICERNRDDVMLTESKGINANELEVNESKKEKLFQWSNTPEDFSLIYRAYAKSKLYRSIIITFKLLPFWYNEASEIPLSLNIPTNKVLLNVYSINGYQYIVYKYKDDENIELTCSTTDVIIKEGYVLCLNEEVQGLTTSKSTNIQLRADQNNKKLECYISNYPPNLPIEYIRGIIVCFYKSNEISNTSGMITGQANAHGSSLYWILLVLGAVVCIPICIYIIWNKKKQQNISIQRVADRPEAERVGDLYREPNKLVVLHSVPLKPEALYSVPFKLKHEDNKNTLELNYAVLDIAPSTNVSRNVDNETTLYAEVCHDSARYVKMS